MDVEQNRISPLGYHVINFINAIPVIFFTAPVPDKFSGGVAPSQLEKGGGLSRLDCQDFNRRARGWGGAGPPAAANYNMQQPAAAAQPAQWQGAGAAGAAGGQWQQPPNAMPAQHYGAEPAGFSDL